MSICVFVKLPVSMEEVMDLLNEVNQKLEDVGEVDEDQVDYPVTSSPGQPTEGHVKFFTPSPSKSVTSPSKRSVVRHGSAVSAKTLRAVYCCWLSLSPSCSSPPKRLLTGWRSRSQCCRCYASRSRPWRSVWHQQPAEKSISFFAFAFSPCEFTFWALFWFVLFMILVLKPILNIKSYSKSSRVFVFF